MECEESFLNGSVSRRTTLRLLVSGSVMALMAACGAPAPAAPPTNAAAQAAPKPTAAATIAPAPAPPKTGGTLNVTFGDLGTESMEVIGSVTNQFISLIYEPLLRYDRQGELMPWLATSVSMSEDGKLWTINLREDVKFSNGDAFTSADVKFSFERYISPEAKGAWTPTHRQTIDRIETPDNHTVKIYAKDPPYVFYPQTLTGTYMHSKNNFEKGGIETFQKQPMGTGPWLLTKYTPSATAELDANKDYWGTKPVWDKLVLRQAPEESTRIALLKRGEADIVGVSIDNAVRLRDNDGFQLRQCGYATVPSYFLPGYWMTSGPTSDGRVREALDIAINRQELVDSFFKGFGKAGAGQIGLTEAAWGFDPIWYSPKYEPDRAKQLLKDASYPGKFADSTVRVFSTTQGAFGWEPDYVQVISGYWQAAGVNTQIVPIDWTAMRSGWIGKDPNIMGGAVPYIGNSSDTTMAAQLNHVTSKGVNNSGNDPELDKNFFAMIGELDANKRLALWKTVQQQAFALHTVVGLARVFDQYAVSDKVGQWTGLDYLNGGFSLGLTGVQRR